MTKTSQVALSKVELTRGSEKFVLPKATLLLHQDYISDNLGGHIPGMRSWEISVASGMPFDVMLGQGNCQFKSGPYSGECFPVSGTMIQGTGPIAGAYQD